MQLFLSKFFNFNFNNVLQVGDHKAPTVCTRNIKQNIFEIQDTKIYLHQAGTMWFSIERCYCRSDLPLLTLRGWGGGGLKHNVGLTLSVKFSNFDSPLNLKISRNKSDSSYRLAACQLFGLVHTASTKTHCIRWF